jgi:cyanate permease
VISVLVCARRSLVIGLRPGSAAASASALRLGFTLSGSFAMALGLLSEYSVDAAASARLTAMAFFVTYTVAAFGPGSPPVPLMDTAEFMVRWCSRMLAGVCAAAGSGRAKAAARTR